jgi:fibro-slime domain-containing protein
MYAPQRSVALLGSLGAFAALFAACTFNPSNAAGGPGSGSGVAGNHATAGTAGSTGTTTGRAGSVGNGNGAGGTAVIGGGGPGMFVPIPADYTMADIGAYKLGDPIPAVGAPPTIDSPAKGCYEILGVVRDFRGSNEPMGHPDFETYAGAMATTGLVAADLGADRKPVYASKCEAAAPDPTACPYGAQTTTKMDYDNWYRTTDGVNMAYEIFFILEPSGNATTFQSLKYFPIDGKGFGNGPNNHNFGFTTELHTKFMYRGGEQFTFYGDDDLWVFVNKKLALDLGGLHQQATGTIDMDTMAVQLGITKGTAYDIELFHAERHTSASNFRIDTNFVFVDCGTIIP